MRQVNVEGKVRALIIDDSRFVRNYLRGLLEGKGFECDEAADGQAGLNRFRGGVSFDLVLLDWNMPVMNGLETLKKIREGCFSETKVLMVTTEAENEFIMRALEAGADEYLMKPFDHDALDDKLAMLGLVEVER